MQSGHGSPMKWQQRLRQPGVLAAFGAALLFGAGTPVAKLLLRTVDPWLLAGLLYLGSGLGLTLVGPVLLMFGLTERPRRVPRSY